MPTRADRQLYLSLQIRLIYTLGINNFSSKALLFCFFSYLCLWTSALLDRKGTIDSSKIPSVWQPNADARLGGNPHKWEKQAVRERGGNEVQDILEGVYLTLCSWQVGNLANYQRRSLEPSNGRCPWVWFIAALIVARRHGLYPHGCACPHKRRDTYIIKVYAYSHIGVGSNVVCSTTT